LKIGPCAIHVAVAAALIMLVAGRLEAQSKSDKIVGMYVHQHWPYNHPYCARTWTVEDWRGYANGLKKLGYNTVLIWPMLETMPDPLTPSDEANLKKIGKVIDILHKEDGMKVYIVLCPNMVAINEEARKATFETRHYYYTEQPVNPGDSAAVQRMIAWRKKLMRPIRNVDGVAIIDSDPGGYPGSTNQEFVNLLGEHRKMLNSVRPGIELIYWMHAGWRGWSRLFEDAKFSLGTPEEYQDTLDRLLKLNPEPWGMANGYDYAKKRGVEDKVISFNYGRIELEPSFPLTNFGGSGAYDGGALPGPRGVMGNAQTHCAQLPNTFAFARGAQGKPVTEADYVQFANDLIPGQGATIVRGWTALSTNNSKAMTAAAEALAAIPDGKLKPGPLRGLLFGSAKRFITDLVMMLRFKATGEEFAAASEQGRDIKPTFKKYVEAYTAWQGTHGFQGGMDLARPGPAIRKIGHPAIEACFAKFRYDLDPLPGRPNTNFERIRAGFYNMETFSARIGAAMRAALADMK
jgi:hypothetical protein